jgi:hypothetical protein
VGGGKGPKMDTRVVDLNSGGNLGGWCIHTHLTAVGVLSHLSDPRGRFGPFTPIYVGVNIYI